MLSNVLVLIRVHLQRAQGHLSCGRPKIDLFCGRPPDEKMFIRTNDTNYRVLLYVIFRFSRFSLSTRLTHGDAPNKNIQIHSKEQTSIGAWFCRCICLEVCHLSSMGHLPKPYILVPSAPTVFTAGEATEALKEVGATRAHATQIDCPSRVPIRCPIASRMKEFVADVPTGVVKPPMDV